MKSFLCAIILSAGLFSANGFDLVKNGKMVSVETASESPTEKLAKQELQAYLTKITGVTTADKLSGEVIIGTVDAISDLPFNVKQKLRDAENDAFYLYSNGSDKLYIAGNNPLGALCGTYAVLEKFGVRWFYAGELGEEYPSEHTLSLPEQNDFQEASIKDRTFCVCGTSSDFPGTFDWEIRNKMHCNGVRPSWQLPQYPTAEAKKAYCEARMAIPSAGGHDWSDYAVPESMFAAHPEYFVVKKGKRILGVRTERCYSNPEVKRLAVSYYLDALKNDPNTLIVIIANDNGDAFCECENCVKMGTYNGKFSTSNLFHTFSKGVMDEVTKSYPDAHIEVFAYSNYRQVPENPAIKYTYKNAYIFYAAHQRCYAHDFSVKEICNKSFVEEMLSWKGRAPALGLYDYRYDSGNYYAPFEWVMASDIRILKGMNCVKWGDETPTFEGNNWEGDGKVPHAEYLAKSNWQSHYMAARMTWDFTQDAAKLMDEVYHIYYGNAAASMKEYHALRTRLWNAAPGHCMYTGALRTAYCLTTPGADEELSSLLERALKQANSAKIRKRIEQDQFFLDVFWRKPAEKLKKQLAETKELQPEFSSGKVVIDGNLNDEVWLKAHPATEFLTQYQKESAENTFVRVAYDKENLYIAFNAENKKAWSNIRAEVRTPDGTVWEDDSIELQIQPPGDSGTYYHLIINTLGTIYDSRCLATDKDTSWNSHAEVKVCLEGKTYLYEIRIPFASMQAVPGVLPWKFHAMRTVTNLQPPAAREWTSLDGVKPFQPDFYRKVIFGKNYLRNGNFAELVKQNINDKMVEFPKFWSPAGDAVRDFRVEKGTGGNKVWTNGVITTAMGTPKGLTGKNQMYKVVIRAKGKGMLGLRTWSWEGYDVRTNHRRLSDLSQFQLTDTFADYTFSFPYLPKEEYVVLYIDGDKTIEHISCSVVESAE